jgi:hypothetical protein
VVAADGCVLEGAVHAFDLAIIRYAIRGAFSSGRFPRGTALW